MKFNILTAVVAVFLAPLCLKGWTGPGPSPGDVVVEHEWRAAWLTTLNGSDWPSAQDGAQLQKSKLVSMIRDLGSVGINVIFIQVSSNQDAIYPSKILPWSHVLTGEQGKDPHYDPLALAVRTCREEGLQVHAWINPFRCGKWDFVRDPSHVVLSSPQYVQRYGDYCYLDPGLPGVRDRLRDIVTELLVNYDLDGIHIDDYFYPEGLSSDPKEWNDDKTYRESGTALPREQWRLRCVDECVRVLHQTTHSVRPGAVFGVSPSGRLVNSRRLYADPSVWCAEGTVDYIVPQIYWNRGHAVADFEEVLDSWEAITGDVPLFVGLASYKYGQVGFEDISEYGAQVEACRERSYVCGHAWFPARTILSPSFRDFLRDGVYVSGALPPTVGESPFPPPEAPSVTVEGTSLKWEAVEGADGYAVYGLRREGEDVPWKAHLLGKGPGTTFEGKAGAGYVVLSYRGKMISQVPIPVFVPLVGR